MDNDILYSEYNSRYDHSLQCSYIPWLMTKSNGKRVNDRPWSGSQGDLLLVVHR